MLLYKYNGKKTTILIERIKNDKMLIILKMLSIYSLKKCML